MSIAHSLFQVFIRITAGITVCNRRWTSSLDQDTQTKWLIQFPQLSLMVYTEQERADSIGEKQNQTVWGDSLRTGHHSSQPSCSEGQRFLVYPYPFLTVQLGIKDQMKQTLWTHFISAVQNNDAVKRNDSSQRMSRTAVPIFLAPGTDFTEDNFSMDWGRERGWFQDDWHALHELYFYYYIGSTSDHQTVDSRDWGSLLEEELPFMLSYCLNLESYSQVLFFFHQISIISVFE